MLVLRIPISLSFFFSLTRPPPTSTLFPYTTLFRSGAAQAGAAPCRRSALPRGHGPPARDRTKRQELDRKSTRLNSSHTVISYAVFCLKKKKKQTHKKNNATQIQNNYEKKTIKPSLY